MGAMYQQEPNPTQSRGAFCAEHAERAAVTICTRCGSYACDACLRVGQDRQDYCYRCVPLMQELATPGTRFVAVVIDQCATFLLPIVLGSILGAIFGGGSSSGGDAFGLLGVLAMLGMAVYQLYLLSTTGQSLGKRTMGIKVVRADGSPVDLARLIFLRNFVPGLVGMFTCNLFNLVDPLFVFSNDHRCLHDHIADTKVIKVNEHTR